ncbi:MAG: LytTR family transcriptional regulator DNA-binding domain-containing protein [Sphingomonas sp.]|nr:LytTR family transcriptional regulator DNA-binding domain-containing protein [Sphingomonas sp.]
MRGNELDGVVESWEPDLGQLGWWMRLLLFAAAAGGTIGLIGFLSGDLLICLFDWTGMIVIGTGLAAGLLPGMIRVGRRLGLPLGAAAALAVALTAIPIAGAAALFSAWAWPKEVGKMSAADWYIRTLLVEAFIVAGWTMLEQVRRARSLGIAVSLPVASDVLCLQMEDHYVRIHRPGGSTIELMPMKAAIARYGRPDGLRVHRSWWVAHAAIRAVEQDGRNWRLVLSNGLVVPVARSGIASVRGLNLV